MRDFVLIYWRLLRYSFRWDNTKGNGWKIALLAIPTVLGIGAVLGLVWLVNWITPTLYQYDLIDELLTYTMFVAIFVVLFLGIVSMISYLYLSRDVEFFAALPIKHSTVFIAKLGVIYTMQLIVTTVIVLPIVVTVGVTLSMNVYYYLGMLLALLAVPIIPLALASIISMPTMYVVSFFKKRAAVTSVLVLLVFGLVYGLYFWVVGSIGVGGDQQADTLEYIVDFVRTLAPLTFVLAPLTSAVRLAIGAESTIFGSFSVSLSGLINFTTFVVAFGVLMTTMIWISSRLYYKGVASQLEGNSSAKSIRSKDGTSTPFLALVGKEWKEMIRTPAFAFNCLSSIVITPALAIYMAVSINVEGVLGSLIIIVVILTLGTSLNIGAATIITREGDKFHYIKTMPVDYYTQVRAKLMVHKITGALSITLSVIGFMIVSQEYLLSIVSLGFLLIWMVALINFSAIFDLSKPKLNWTTPNEAVRRNINVTAALFVNMGISILLVGIASVWYFVALSQEFAQTVVDTVLYVILYVVASAMLWIFSAMLRVKTAKLVERIEM